MKKNRKLSKLQLSSIWSIDRTLSGATTPGQCEPPKLQHYWGLTIRVFNRTLVGGGGSPNPWDAVVYSTAPADWIILNWARLHSNCTHRHTIPIPMTEKNLLRWIRTRYAEIINTLNENNVKDKTNNPTRLWPPK